ncbi:MAG: hypothetical protein M3O87_02695, partial [Candidatus Dormibacteraeota bacterium]|nr:hypothetical protein [Candidatus Dormibacteraeota bacterium]
PAESELAGAADVYTPPAEAEAPAEAADAEAGAAEPAPAAEPEPAAADTAAPVEAPADEEAVAAGAAMAGAAIDEAPVAAASPEESMSFVPCTNHPHLPAVGLCPGCLDPFCIDCLPEREGQPLACNRCAGIQARLGVTVNDMVAAGYPDPQPAAAAGSPPPAAGGFPPPAPGVGRNLNPEPPAQPAAAPEEKKKKWPF